jgi:hypothetical protein
MTRGSASRGAGTSIASANGHADDVGQEAAPVAAERAEPEHRRLGHRRAAPGQAAAAAVALAARDLERDDDEVARRDGLHVAADGEHLGDALVPHRDRHRQRRPAGRHRAVEVARRDRDRPHQRLPPVLEIRLRHVLPRQLAGSGQNQLAHRPDATGRRR